MVLVMYYFPYLHSNLLLTRTFSNQLCIDSVTTMCLETKNRKSLQYELTPLLPINRDRTLICPKICYFLHKTQN